MRAYLQTGIRSSRSWGVSLSVSPIIHRWPADYTSLGGSFGVVYKAIEVATGEVVAIKHVGSSGAVTYQLAADVTTD